MSGPGPRATRARDRWRAALPGLLLVVLGLVAFAILLDSVQEQDDLHAIDEPVLNWLAANRSAAGTTALYLVTLVSGPVILPILVGSGVLAWGVTRHRWWRPLLLLGATCAASLISLAVKRRVARPRPPVEYQYVPGAETTFSFPSGHTIVTATLCLVAGYLLWSRHRTKRRLAGWLAGSVVVTAAVGLSRLYLGYHFVTDVLAAVALAVAVLGVVVAADRLRTLRRRAGPPERP